MRWKPESQKAILDFLTRFPDAWHTFKMTAAMTRSLDALKRKGYEIEYTSYPNTKSQQMRLVTIFDVIIKMDGTGGALMLDGTPAGQKVLGEY